MVKLISLFHRHSFLIKIPYLQSTSLAFTTYQQLLPELDPTMSSIHSVSSNPCFSLLGLCRNISSLRKIHALLLVHGLTGDILCDTKLASLYGSFGHVQCARLVFDQIRRPDFYSWKVMIRWYFLNDECAEIMPFYNRMRTSVRETDDVVFSIALKACCELRALNEGMKIHCQIVKSRSQDSFVLTGLVDMYAKCGEIHYSSQVFDEIYDRNVVSWTSMIVGYVQNDCAREGLILFNRMREALVDGNQFTFGSLVTACTKLGSLHQGKWLHGYVIKNGLELNSYLSTAFLNMYVKCGKIEDACLIFDELSSVDLVSWTAMIVGYTQSGCPTEALSLFIDKKWVDIFPNNVTISSVLSACGQMGFLNFGRSIHALGIKLGLQDSAVINSLVDMYAKCQQNGHARYLFEMVSEKDVIAWNSIISGYSQNGFSREAVNLFNRMRSESVMPDAVTLVSVISACSSVGALRVGCSLHAYSIKDGLIAPNVYVGTALLNFYAKCGDAISARTIFDGMGEKNTVTWSAMIGGHGMQGDSRVSLSLFDDMLKEALKPNEVIFTTILSACSHTGKVVEGWRYFNSMCEDYNFVPSMKHYACMVDLLARSGRLEEALELIKNMPIQPDVSCFGAFLHGCGLHSRFDLGQVAVTKMLELHLDEACYYILMANLYASDGRWSQVDQVRELMKQRGLSKYPGCSLVETEMNGDLLCPSIASFA